MAEVLVTHLAFHILTIQQASAPNLSGAVPFFIMSGVSYVNAVGATPFTVSAEWDSSVGTAPFVYNWQLSNVENEAGFVSTATSADITRTYTNAGGSEGRRGVSATISDANSTVSATFFVHVKAEKTPNPFDGVFQGENQPRRKTYP
jgi:hypothetical protein